MRIKLTLTMIIGLLYLATHSYSQSPNALAQIVNIEHVCGENLGAVEFELLGNPENFTYYWTHGPETLILQNLSPGTYTFIVKNIYGCEEEHEVEILDLSQCEVTYNITDGKEPCIKKITLIVTSNGLPIPIENLNISWNDNPNESGLVRYFNTNYIGGGIIICAAVSTIVMEEICCSSEVCIPLIPTPPCGKKYIEENPEDQDDIEAHVASEDNKAPTSTLKKQREDDDYFENQNIKISEINSLKVYPNPFLNEFVMNYHSSNSGEANISIHTIQGELIASKKWHSEKGNQVHSYVAEDKLLPGIYILKFSFPSGIESHKRIIRVASLQN